LRSELASHAKAVPNGLAHRSPSLVRRFVRQIAETTLGLNPPRPHLPVGR
jgi:hypothetical protein